MNILRPAGRLQNSPPPEDRTKMEESYQRLAEDACRLSLTKNCKNRSKAQQYWQVIEEGAVKGNFNARLVVEGRMPNGMTVVENTLQALDYVSCLSMMRLLPPGLYADGRVEKRDNWLSTLYGTGTKNFSCHLRESGAVFIGETKNGLGEGYGELRRPDGGGYRGMWKDDLKHGQGTLFDVGGRILPSDVFFKEDNFDHYIKPPNALITLLEALSIPTRRTEK